jgi:CBS domain-containing protein
VAQGVGEQVRHRARPGRNRFRRLAGDGLTCGPGSHPDWDWIEAAAANVSNARLTTLLLPGIGTIHDLKRAYELGIRSVRVATHSTKADSSAEHIATARTRHGRGRIPHDESPHRATGIGPAGKLMESYGANCVYVTDSGGRLMMGGIRDRVRAYRDVLDPATEIGVHAHENLSLAVANPKAAVVALVDAAESLVRPLRDRRCGSTADRDTLTLGRRAPDTSAAESRMSARVSTNMARSRISRIASHTAGSAASFP